MIYVGDRVVVVAEWSSFFGWRGKVTQVKPWTAVLFDGDRLPMRIEEPSIARDESSMPMVAGD